MSYVFNDMVEFSNVILKNRDFTRALNYPEEVDVGSFRSLIRSFFTSREDIDGIYVYTPQDTYYVGAVKSADVRRSVEERLAHTSGAVVWIDTKPERINILSGQYRYFSPSRKLIDLIPSKKISDHRYRRAYPERLLPQSVAEGKGGIRSRRRYVISHADVHIARFWRITICRYPSAPQEHGFTLRLNDGLRHYSVQTAFDTQVRTTDYPFGAQTPPTASF